MRVYPYNLLLSGMWALVAWLAILQTGWEPVFLGVAVVLGLLIGAAQALPVLRGLDKKGEYRASRIWLIAVLIVLAGFLGALFSGILPIFPSPVIGSLYLSLPIGYATSAGLFLRWEIKRGRGVHLEGILIGRFYAVPKLGS